MSTITTTLTKIKEAALRLHEDESGAEGLEKVLILGAIALPLLGMLIVFRDKLTDFLSDEWKEESEDSTGGSTSDDDIFD